MNAFTRNVFLREIFVLHNRPELVKLIEFVGDTVANYRIRYTCYTYL